MFENIQGMYLRYIPKHIVELELGNMFSNLEGAHIVAQDETLVLVLGYMYKSRYQC